MIDLTIQTKAIRAVLAAVGSEPEPPWGYPTGLDTVLTNEHGEPRLGVARIVEIVLDVVTKSILEGQR